MDRALDVLAAVAAGRASAGVSEIAERTGLYKSSVHRLLATLERRGFVQRDARTDKYSIGLAVLELASAFSRDDDLTSLAYPEMERLRNEIDETVSLYVRDGTERVRVQKAESRQAVRRVVQIGQRAPLYLGASGKVLLAFAPPEVREKVLDSPRREGIERSRLREQLADLARQGYASSVEEREPGSAAVAAPVFDGSGEVVAALAVSGPSGRFDSEIIARYGQAVIEAAQRISRRLAWR